jgi:hypothetical protein
MKKLLFILPVVLTLSACSGTTTLKTENAKKREVPTWYLKYKDTGTEASAWYKPWDRDGYVYAVAEDVSPSMEMAVRKATIKAKAKLADRITGALTNRTIIKYEERGTAQSPTGSSQAQDMYVNTIAENVLRVYGLDKKEVIFNPQLRNYRAFVMIKLSRDDLDAVAARHDETVLARNNNRQPSTSRSLEDNASELVNQVRR